MNPQNKSASLVNTLSVRLDDATFARLVTAARNQRRQLSDYVRLLIEHAEPTAALHAEVQPERHSVGK